MKIIINILKLLLAASILLFGYSFYQKNQIPPVENIQNKLFEEPLQTETSQSSFEVTAGGKAYKINPLYNYQLSGLVVSYHHSESWFDYYHINWQDFINLKDICVIWGENVKSGNYKNIKFTSGSYTCYSKWANQDQPVKFYGNQLSNNHLISNNQEINKKILEVKRGDQIYLKGYLATYSHANGQLIRKSSTTRNDVGNGACETIYVTEFEILQKATRIWYITNSLSLYAIIALVIFFLFRFLYIVFKPYKKTDKYYPYPPLK